MLQWAKNAVCNARFQNVWSALSLAEGAKEVTEIPPPPDRTLLNLKICALLTKSLEMPQVFHIAQLGLAVNSFLTAWKKKKD